MELFFECDLRKWKCRLLSLTGLKVLDPLKIICRFTSDMPGVFEPVPVTRKWKAAHGHGLSDGSFDSEHTRLELWNRIIALPMLTQAWKETEECKTQGAARWSLWHTTIVHHFTMYCWYKSFGILNWKMVCLGHDVVFAPVWRVHVPYCLPENPVR